MKRYIHYILLVTGMVLGSRFALAQGSNLEVVVKKIKNAEGDIRVAVFNTEGSYLNTPTDGKIVAASEGTVTVVFTNLLPGDYAISVVHDANRNGKLDYNALGIPKEGVGFGNNATGSFGPPSFDKAKVNLNGKDLSCTVELKYY